VSTASASLKPRNWWLTDFPVPTPKRFAISRCISTRRMKPPRRIPSAKWRELIKKGREADPLMCPRCGHEMRIVSLIDDRAVIE